MTIFWKMIFLSEIWKDIETNKTTQVSNLGNIKSEMRCKKLTRDEMIIDNQNLIYFVLKKLNLYDKRELIKGVDSFDAQKGTASTYLYRCIYTTILMEVRKKRPITISLDTPISNIENLTFQDIIIDDFNFVENILKQDQIKQLYSALNKLSFKDKDIIIKAFGLFNTKQYKQKEIAKLYGYSQSYISRIIENAKRNINKEIKRSKAITDVAQTIINNAQTVLDAQKFIATDGRSSELPKMLLGTGKND